MNWHEDVHLFSVCSPAVMKTLNESTVTESHRLPLCVCVCFSLLFLRSVFSVEVKSLFISNKETKWWQTKGQCGVISEEHLKTNSDDVSQEGWCSQWWIITHQAADGGKRCYLGEDKFRCIGNSGTSWQEVVSCWCWIWSSSHTVCKWLVFPWSCLFFLFFFNPG